MYILNILQPLEQFSLQIVYKFLSIEFTNFFIYWCIVLFILSILFIFPLHFLKIIPNSLHLIIKNLYSFILNLFYQQTNNFTALQYFPLIFCIFLIILFSNLLGLTPFGFTLTSHLFVTAFMSISIFLGITILGFINNKFIFFTYFVPSGVSNKGLLYFLICIEVVSYIIRPLSLAIRLFANMLAGHTLLFILTGFVIQIAQKKILFFIFLPLIIIFLVFFLELAIAFIQAYVFTILLIIYLNDIYNIGSH